MTMTVLMIMVTSRLSDEDHDDMKASDHSTLEFGTSNKMVRKYGTGKYVYCITSRSYVIFRLFFSPILSIIFYSGFRHFCAFRAKEKRTQLSIKAQSSTPMCVFMRALILHLSTPLHQT